MTSAKILIHNRPSSLDMDMINRYTRRPYEPEEVYVFSLALCDNEVDRDFERFSVESLEKLRELFLGKTCIFDHERKSANQTARIYHTGLEEKHGETTQAGEELVRLMARAYLPRTAGNAETIEFIESSILKKVSVGCAVKRRVCSICGKESCEHQKGKVYGGKLAHTVLTGPTDAYECAFVVVPKRRSDMKIKTYDNIYRTALEKYGANSQILMVMEEMSELQKELCKNRRGAENTTHIAEEIADVEIMLEQMKLFFDVGEQVEKIKEFKILRLYSRLEEYGGR